MLRILSLVITALAIFYVLEGVGVVDKRVYFPTLPRLEASAASPAAWLDAASWGVKWVSCASQKGGLTTCAHQLDGQPGAAEQPADTAEAPADTHERFTDRVAAKHRPTA